MREPIMQGRGYYNQHSELQARSAEAADGMLERALAAVAIPAGPPTIADFGSSQGHNSMRPIALMLDRLTERIGRERDVRVVHTDLPHCDYTSLFVMLESSPDSYPPRQALCVRLCDRPFLLRPALPCGQPYPRLVLLCVTLDERPSHASARAHLAGPSLLG
jgi:hypothetical protein